MTTAAAAPLYLDSSALVKLALQEAETAALRRFLRSRPVRVSSALARAEVLRAVRRSDPRPVAVRAARRVLAGVTLLAVNDAILERAATLDPLPLRTLDAIHLASALALGHELDGLVTYDERLAEAARAQHITVHAPR